MNPAGSYLAPIRVTLLAPLTDSTFAPACFAHSVHLADALAAAGFDVHHLAARCHALGIGCLEPGRHDSQATFSTLEFTADQWTRQNIQTQFRRSVESVSPDFVIVADPSPFMPWLVEAISEFPYILRHTPALPSSHHEPAPFLSALSEVGTVPHQDRLFQALWHAHDVLAPDPRTQADLDEFANSVRIVPFGVTIDPSNPAPTLAAASPLVHVIGWTPEQAADHGLTIESLRMHDLLSDLSFGMIDPRDFAARPLVIVSPPSDHPDVPVLASWAMAAGTPMLAAHGSIADFLITKNGSRYHPGDPADLPRKLQQMLRNLDATQAIALDVQMQAVEQFGWNTVVQRAYRPILSAWSPHDAVPARSIP